MNDLAQAIIVTVVAAGALIVLVRPILGRGKSTSTPAGGCESCAAADTHGPERQSGGSARH